MKKTKKRLSTALLTLVMLIVILPTSTYAAEITMDLSKADISWDHILIDKEGNRFNSAYGLKEEDNPFGYSLSAKERTIHDYTAKRPGLDSNKSEWIYGKDYVYCFCIEHGVGLPDSKNYAASDDLTFGDKYKQFSATQKDLLTLALIYGYPNRKDVPTSRDANACYAATQVIVWQITLGFRTSATELNDKTYPMSGHTGTMTEQYCKNKYFKHYYSLILSDMENHFKRPSFTSTFQNEAPSYEMDYRNGKYSITLTDTNNVLQNFYVSSNSGVSTTINNNTLTITSSKPITSAATIKLNRRIPSTGFTTGFLIWSVPGKENQNQDMVSGVPINTDPVPAYFRIKAPAGHMKLVKTSEDGKIEGVRFQVTGNGFDKTVQTDKNGEIFLPNLQPGIYSISEETDNQYEPQNVQRVTIVSGQTSTVTFNNHLKRGKLQVIKTSEDNFVEGITFHLTGTSSSGLAVNEYAKTNAEGIALFENVLIGSNYTLEELSISEQYVIPRPMNITIEWNKITEESVDNALKKFRVSVLKSDAEIVFPQGDASLCEAVYGLYKGEQLVASYQTDQTGAFTSDWFVCGTDWTLREISASTGYLIDSKIHTIKADPKEYEIKYNELSIGVTETVKKGKISIIKHCDDGSTQIETPESGAAFQIFLAKSGSYEAARDIERDILICNKNGFAESKKLPYGVYTVHQIKGWEGKEFIDDFQVFISEDGENYPFIINNDTFKSEISITKIDAETKRIIPAEGIGFRVKDLSTGKYISQHINYPMPINISIFYTSSEGKLMLPQPLPYGHYELWEENACKGYVLAKTPITFTVDGSQTTIHLEMPNMPQKARIIITKTGEVFSSITECENKNNIAFPTLYRPVYSTHGFSNAIYEVRAAENIYTPDGTLRYEKGIVVSEVTTDSSGKAITEPLYLGKYEIREVKAPYGMLLNNEIHSIELIYAGQEVEITDVSTSFHNERQTVAISLNKVMEKNEKFGIGQNNEILSVQFGLFSTEDLTASDGSVIPKNGLLETVRCNVDGKAFFTTNLPIGAKCYVMEIATDDHYILSDEKFPVIFEYAGQDTPTVSIEVNSGKPIFNTILMGAVKGLKIDRETEETISGAVFGLFAPNEIIFTAETALLTVKSGADGEFLFEDIPYGIWNIKELQPAEKFLPNEEIYMVQITENEEIVEITVVNDRIPEIYTNATVDGKKEISATEVFTLEDVVSYQHLIPGQKYVIKGVLMDKNTGRPILINNEEIRSESKFIPETAAGEIVLPFMFDSRFIKEDTNIVIYETLYRENIEITAHTDIEDMNQTVSVWIPKIETQANIDGEKENTVKDQITIEDIVSYKNLTPGKEYTVKGVLMNKTTGRPLLSYDKEICSEETFIPETANGTIMVSFTFEGEYLKKTTEIVVFETLYRENVPIAVHADLDDLDQTIIIQVTPPPPQTGDNSHPELWLILAAVSGSSLILCCIRHRKYLK